MRDVKCSAWVLPLSKCSVVMLTETPPILSLHLLHALGFLHRAEAALQEGGPLQTSLYLVLLLFQVSQLGKGQDNVGT